MLAKINNLANTRTFLINFINKKTNIWSKLKSISLKLRFCMHASKCLINQHFSIFIKCFLTKAVNPCWNKQPLCSSCHLYRSVRHAGSVPYPVEKLHLPWPDISVQSHPSAVSKRCWQRGLTDALHLHCSCEKTDEALKMESKNKQRINYHMISYASRALFPSQTVCNCQAFPTFTRRGEWLINTLVFQGL